MKAIHKQTNQEYNVEEVIAETVVLKNREGIERRIGYDLFKSQYQLSEGHLSHQKTPGGAKELAQEVLTECSEITQGQKAKPKKLSRRGEESKPKSKRSPNKKSSNEKPSNKKPSKKENSEEIKATTTLKDICEELGITPSAARRILRKEGVEKPGNSWSWTSPTDIAKIKGLLK